MNQMRAEEILKLDPLTIADQVGLRQILSKGRNDGLASMMRVIQSQICDLLAREDGETTDDEEGIAKGSAPTVALLLSGGVDSAVALNLLKRQGYNVTAFYLKIWLEDELSHLGQCPWEDDFRMCQEICSQAQVPLEAISLQQEYKQRVISYTVNEAKRGRTPNPDIMCNSRVKFGCFYDAIEGRGFDHIASGHYAQLVFDEKTGTKKLLRAPDPIKDQSYFLCALTQHQLSRILFPIGNMQKDQVRELAREFDLPNKHRPDSQGLCFLGKVKFDEFLAAYLGERPGDILDAATGEILGRHKGVWYHTVGQRKGIGKVLLPKATSRGPWYVVSKDPSKDIVYASNEYDEEIFEAPRTNIFVEDIHWIAGEPPSLLLDQDGGYQPDRFHMKIRHGPKLVDGSLLLQEKSCGNVMLENKDGGLAPGQFVVFYKKDNPECLGGGVISERHWAEFLTQRQMMNVTNVC
jgi:tRNA-specific 2-thiouridylase